MPKDALTIYKSAEELQTLVGGKIDKVTMPDRDTLIFLVHTRQGNHRLLLSCNPSLPRVHITLRKYQNPDVASGVLMYFRKRLVGANIVDIIPDKTERMITFELSALDELRERVTYELKAELTGKCANIIFIENGKIGNALRRVTSEAPGKRAVLPGLDYLPPNATGRSSVFDDRLKMRVLDCDASAQSAFNACVAGLAAATVDELFYRLGISSDAKPTPELADRVITAARSMYNEKPRPCVTFDSNGKPLDFFVSPYGSCGGDVKHYPTVNDAMDAYYSALFDAQEFNLYSKPLKAAVKSAYNKSKKRQADALARLSECADRESERIKGELITANIYKIQKGATSVVADNWYDGTTVTVELDPSKTPSQNAAAHFKQYNKKKRAVTYARDALDAARESLDRLDGIAAELELCTARSELDEVKSELVELGLIKPDRKKQKSQPAPSEPYSFDVFGATLLVGKNHAQNDRITRGAAKTDTWMHVKDVHGSHAVLKTTAPTDEQLTRAAEICAYYSRAHGSENVAVDYTLAKHVFPHGGGRVEYKEYKTLFVSPKN